MFVDRSDLLLNNPERLHYGICVTDIDGDGQFEWLVAGFGGPNRAYKWTGQHYEDIAPHALADSRRQAIGLAACDIDGNGREEIYVLNTDTFGGAKRFADRLFAYGDGWIDLYSLPQNQSALNLTAGRSVVAIDRNGDGLYGFFVANYGGPMRLYELDDDGILHDVAPLAGLDKITGGRGVVALPIVSDHMDIFAGNEHGPNFLFRNEGDGTFTEIASQVGIGDPFEHVRGIAALDTNGDGRFDLVYGNWEGPHRMFVQSSDGIWDDIAPEAMANPSRIRTVIAADFDNDGFEELFFNNIGEPNRLFAQRDGEWVQIDIGEAEEADGLGTGAAVADLDGDGRLELLIAHGESSPQPLSLYQTSRNSNHYLRVLPLTRYGAPARGALVTLKTASRTQQRAIDAGSGYLCQMEPVAHFGMGPETNIESVTVRWPDGHTQKIDHPQPDQLLRITY
ncbi:MAG: CRTAC1 family protein [Anaerolineae bacterium]|nr:CRTAC1 family protein [Anaerolineae bacterium]MCA9894469.1 CRTAC1 family protein [Anaerolineae bacterium]